MRNANQRGGGVSVPVPLDPVKDAEFIEAQRATSEILASNPSRSSDPTLPLFVFFAHRSLKQEHARFLKGDRMALLGAIRICANHDVPLPQWASRAFIGAYDQVLSCGIGSWDEAFGSPYGKGKHLSRLRQARQNRVAIWLKVSEAVKAGESINIEFWERIGSELGVGKTRAQELFAEARDKLGLGNPRKSRISRD